MPTGTVRIAGQTVIVNTPPDPRTGATQLSLDPLEFIHAVTAQIPDRGQHLTRACGFYSHRARGARARAVSKSVDKQPEQAPESPPPAPGQAPQAGTAPAKERSLEDMAEEATTMGDYKAAAELLSKALEAKPDDPELLYKPAQALARNGDFGTALREGQKVLVMSPERKEVRRKMAAWLMDRGDMDGALPLLEKEKILDPENPAVAKLLVAVFDAAGRKEDMVKEAERWLQLAPKDTEAVLAMANIKTQAGDFAAAEKLFQDLASSDPENAPTMYFNAGVSTMNKPGLGPEDRKRAITAFKKALELNPKMAKAYMRMGECYLGLGDYPTARAQFEQFLKVAPLDDPEIKDAKDMIKALPTK